ncbi:DEAD/DEAH box helicase [Shimia sp. R11_0]|uniref:ATP-dependent RNA helicase RhlE n=1 Tax=Shimia marina TaxID=321267 RepID=A0A0N7LSK1_9RHOB|nr:MULTISPECIES: DEAD/DEAH box helicase [Shimia]MBO9476453.1 DEAD/DEAH box helicase [Shimia sp. R11_0]CUH53844.1 ATP-dependent RNA helicase RhlE [Shimia marina]SFE21440.1 ATP-dependent RNA helicase RhlE [Shimia marina]
MSTFDGLGLSPTLLKGLKAAGFDAPTPIQQKAIPLALEGHDILGLAQTGTGKSLAFGLPMMDQLLAKRGKPAPKTVKALVLAPTRELVNQIADNLRPMVQGTPMKVMTVVGGQSINRQISMLSRGTDILVATPGRLIDLLDRREIDLSTVGYLVLDEADQMLDMGFIHSLRKIAPHLGTPRQTMLFSATMPKQMEELSRAYLSDPKRVEIAPPGKTADKIAQSVEFHEKAEKRERLREILSENMGESTLIFSRTKHGAERMKKQLVAEGFNAASIHGNKSQGQRDRAIEAFRNGEVTVLVATDVAARGIDIPVISLVINFDLPNVAESYVHRIGRTARAGRDGRAISFCAADERDYLKDIEKLIGRRFDRPEGEPEEPKKQYGRGPRSGGGGKSRNRGRGSGQKAAQSPSETAARKGDGAKPNTRRPRRRRNRAGKPAA